MDGRQWHRAIPGELIHSNEIHVWRAFLDLNSDQLARMAGMLSTDEVERAGRFRFERDQRRFIMARGILREILGRYLGKDPRTLRFDYTTYGKPLLSTSTGYDNIQFNLSHSDAFALYAFTPVRSIGIDIELIRDDVAAEHIAQRFFSVSEISLLEGIDQNKRAGAFFQYWTRKEAFLKALGEGVSFPMEQCDVSFINGSSWSPISMPGNITACPCWYGQDLFPGPGYAAAISAESGDLELSYLDYAL